jgi:UDP-glucuronate decarboxylase
MAFRCLVTGGAGFLGSNLCDRLIDLGHEVVVIDNFYTGHRRNVAHLVGRAGGAGRAGFSLIEHDVTKPFPETGAMEARFDRIFNLACPASPPHYQRDPIFTMLTSVLGTLHGLKRAQRDGARFFQASTSEVYGDPEVHPQTEAYRGCVSTIGPRACYDEGKRAAESLCMDFSRGRGVEGGRVDVRIVRIFNTYGPRMDPDDGRVVSNFIVQALRGEPITLYGDGQQTRSFCYVDDLLDGFLKLMEHPSETGPVNIGNDGEFTVKELAELVRELTGTRSPIVYRPRPVDDPMQRRPDLSMAREVLGFAHRVPLREGIERTIEYFSRRSQLPPPPEAES